MHKCGAERYHRLKVVYAPIKEDPWLTT